MIPDFKTYIKESIWADIYDRGTGETERKEDNPYIGRDINSLSGEEFCDYLTYRYEILESDIMDSMHSRSISVPLYLFSGYRHLSITYSDTNKYKIVEVSIVNLTPRLPAGLYKKLSERFDLEYNKKFMITNFLPKDGKYTNSYCLEIIDFILENTDCQVLMKKKGIVSESIWADIYDRSTGDSVRKEDDVDWMDNQRLAEYIEEKYKILCSDDMVEYNEYGNLRVPVFKYLSFYSYVDLSLNNYNKSIVLTYRNLVNVQKVTKKELTGYDTILSGLESNYTTAKKLTINDKWYDMKISPKDGSEITNTFFLEVLDTIISLVDEKNTQNLYKLIEKK